MKAHLMQALLMKAHLMLALLMKAHLMQELLMLALLMQALLMQAHLMQALLIQALLLQVKVQRLKYLSHLRKNTQVQCILDSRGTFNRYFQHNSLFSVKQESLLIVLVYIPCMKLESSSLHWSAKHAGFVIQL
jgi:hypothetical protein